MKKRLFYLAIATLMATNTLSAQTSPYENDVKSIDALMKASYEVVSGEKGAKRQWERDTYLHHPKAVYSYFDEQTGQQVTQTLDEFHKLTDDMVFNTAFYENEINRVVNIFGNIAQVWSTYETRLEKNGPVARRGINSVQLVYENNRWYVISWVFAGESKTNRIPPTFDRH